MARVTIHKCDRCGNESRENNNLTEVTIPSAGFKWDICPACIEKMDKFLRFGSKTGDRFYQAEVMHVAADVIKENAGNLQDRDAVRLEGELRTLGSILEED